MPMREPVRVLSALRGGDRVEGRAVRRDVLAATGASRARAPHTGDRGGRRDEPVRDGDLDALELFTATAGRAVRRRQAAAQAGGHRGGRADRRCGGRRTRRRPLARADSRDEVGVTGAAPAAARRLTGFGLGGRRLPDRALSPRRAGDHRGRPRAELRDQRRRARHPRRDLLLGLHGDADPVRHPRRHARATAIARGRRPDRGGRRGALCRRAELRRRRQSAASSSRSAARSRSWPVSSSSRAGTTRASSRR